jgi:hypothetical protein
MEVDNSFESTDGEFGIQKQKKGKYLLEKGGKKKWFDLPPKLGGGRKNVVRSVEQLCKCKKHQTVVHVLEGNIVVFYCNKAKQFAWMQL